MSPKEKARQLVLLFIQFTPADEEYELPYAKKCAVICVNEIIKSKPKKKSIAYWQEVKQEIENL